jgi:hypothetical protein
MNEITPLHHCANGRNEVFLKLKDQLPHRRQRNQGNSHLEFLQEPGLTNRLSKFRSNCGTDQPANSAFAQSILAPGQVTGIHLLRAEVLHFAETQ